MKIFTQIKNSVYNKEYYSNIVLNQSLRESVKYLAKLSLLIALLGVIIFAFSIPSLSNQIKKGVYSFVAEYPDDLIVSIKDGNATVNQPEPYLYKIPDNLINSNDAQSLKIDNLVTINTSLPFSLDKFKEYSTFSLITKKELVLMQSEKGQVRIMPLSDLGNLEITKAWVLDKEGIFTKILPWIMAILIPLVYIATFMGIFIGTIIILFFYAAITWALLRTKGINANYMKSYQVSLHAITILLIIGVFSKFLGPLDNFFVRAVILMAIVYFNFDNNSNLIKTEI